jgi:predicted DsbA family dithiol-disulfide isomerase
MIAQFKKMATGLDLPSCELKKIYNSRSAQELGYWAKSLDKEDQYHDAVFKAFYGEGKDISNKKVLVDIVESIDLPGIDAVKHLEMETFKSQVDSDWKLAKNLELVAAPTYIINQNKLVGAHSYEKLQHFVESNGATKRTILT